jgi:putative spermidine/putrescine transport system ATP-binding protein
MNMVELRQVSKRYAGVDALSSVDLVVRKGEFVTLLGPSGSGKTTVLNLIAGMIEPSAGRVFIDGRDATDWPPSQRGLGMVFQNYALMPHMTVFENIAFPLRVRRLPRARSSAGSTKCSTSSGCPPSLAASRASSRAASSSGCRSRAASSTTRC